MSSIKNEAVVVSLEEAKLPETKVESLDDLVEVIEGDALRHVIGGGRDKTGPFTSAA